MIYILAKAPPGQRQARRHLPGHVPGGDESLTSRAWVDSMFAAKARSGRSIREHLDGAQPNACLKEGDTPSWFFFLPRGGNVPADPSKPGWGGQFQKDPDGWSRDLPARDGFHPRDTVNRWRPAFQPIRPPHGVVRREAAATAGATTPARSINHSFSTLQTTNRLFDDAIAGSYN